MAHSTSGVCGVKYIIAKEDASKQESRARSDSIGTEKALAGILPPSGEADVATMHAFKTMWLRAGPVSAAVFQIPDASPTAAHNRCAASRMRVWQPRSGAPGR